MIKRVTVVITSLAYAGNGQENLVIEWGPSSCGSIDYLDEPIPFTPASIEGHNNYRVAISSSGELICWEGEHEDCTVDNYGECDISNYGPVLDVATGGTLIGCITLDGNFEFSGDLWSMPDGVLDEINQLPTGQFDEIEFYPGNYSIIAKDTEGYLQWIGGQLAQPPVNPYYAVLRPPNDIQVSSFSLGYYFGAALTIEGEIIAWGNDVEDRLETPEGNDFIQVESSPHHSVALRSDGTAHCWGRNTDGQCDAPEGELFVKVYLRLRTRWGSGLTDQSSVGAILSFVMSQKTPHLPTYSLPMATTMGS